MLTWVEGVCRRGRLRASQAGEPVQVIVLQLAGHTIDLGVNLIRDKPVPPHCNELTTSLVALGLIYGVDPCDCLGLVARGVVVVAPGHLLLVMQGVAYSEPEIDLSRLVWSNGAHDPSDLVLAVGCPDRIFFYEAFEVHTVAVDSNFYERKLWQ